MTETEWKTYMWSETQAYIRTESATRTRGMHVETEISTKQDFNGDDVRVRVVLGEAIGRGHGL